MNKIKKAKRYTIFTGALVTLYILENVVGSTAVETQITGKLIRFTELIRQTVTHFQPISKIHYSRMNFSFVQSSTFTIQRLKQRLHCVQFLSLSLSFRLFM